VNRAAFRDRFPEFRTAQDPFVDSVLNSAATELNADEIGDSFDEAHGLLTAHKIAISPFGANARTLNDKGQTTYQVELDNVMRRAITALLPT
jgi:hypothetical protein